jgi:hypothetical protein
MASFHAWCHDNLLLLLAHQNRKFEVQLEASRMSSAFLRGLEEAE